MKKNLFLILVGILFSLVLLEALLRLMGMAYLLAVDVGNHRFAVQKNEIRILCLGESTTAGTDRSYPRQMEAVLNHSSSQRKFSVINKGVPGITTDNIIGSLQEDLFRYKPDIVIVMMGINDGAFFAQDNTMLLRILGSLRTVRFFRILAEHLRRRAAGAPAPAGPSDNGPSEASLEQAVSRKPQDYTKWMDLGLYYKSQALYAQAIDAFNKSLGLIPAGDALPEIVLLWCLGECYKASGAYQQAIDCYRKVLTAMPGHHSAWADLAEVYMDMQDYATAEKLLVRQIMIEPHEVHDYSLLVSCYEHEKRFDQEEALLRYAVRANPGGLELHQMLGYLLMDRKKYTQALDEFQEVLDIDPQGRHNLRDHILVQMAEIYDRLSEPRKAGMIREKLGPQMGGYSPHTWDNYHALMEVLEKNNIPLIVMQYPLRDPQILQDHLGLRNVTYVDNRRPFDKIVAERGYDYLFTDRFAGDFGHCTLEGNKILARNAASTVLQLMDLAPHENLAQ